MALALAAAAAGGRRADTGGKGGGGMDVETPLHSNVSYLHLVVPDIPRVKGEDWVEALVLLQGACGQGDLALNHVELASLLLLDGPRRLLIRVVVAQTSLLSEYKGSPCPRVAPPP